MKACFPPTIHRFKSLEPIEDPRQCPLLSEFYLRQAVYLAELVRRTLRS